MSEATPVPETSKSPGLAARFSDWVFGYDFFLSYSHGDGLNYPRALKRRLERAGFRVFLDQTDYVAGLDLRRETRRQVIKSRQFVIVGRPAALKSGWVMREVEVALATGRIPVIIDINQSVLNAPDTAALAVMARDSHWLRLNETLADADGVPSDRTVAELERGFSHTRQEAKRQRIFATATAILAIATLIAGWQAFSASRARDLAETQRDRAQRILAQVVAASNRRVQAMAATQAAANSSNKTELASTGEAGALPAGPSLDEVTSALAQSSVLISRGEIAAAASALDRALPVPMAELKSSDPAWQAPVYSALDQRAQIAMATGNAQLAGEYLKTALKIASAAAGREPDPWLARSGNINRKICHLKVTSGAHGEAAEFCSTAIEMLRPLAASDQKMRQSLATAILQLGDAHKNLKSPERARSLYKESLEIFDRLNQESPDRQTIANDRSAVLQSLSDLEFEHGDLNEALQWIDRELLISRPLAATGGEPVFIRNLASSLDRRGRILLKLGRNEEAYAAYEEAVALMDRVAASDEIVARWHRDAATLFESAAKLNAARGEPDKMVARLRKALALREALAASRENPSWQREVEISYKRASELMRSAGRMDDALEAAEQYLLSTTLAPNADGNKSEMIARALGTLCWSALNAGSFDRALWAGKYAAALAPQLDWVHLNLAHAFLLSDRKDEARAIYLDPQRLGSPEGAKWKADILQDFETLKSRKIASEAMAQIAGELK